MSRNNFYTTNQDIRDYMSDRGVTQKNLADALGKSTYTVNAMLKKELPDQQKEALIRHIDAIADDSLVDEQEEIVDDELVETEDDTTVTIGFQIGDRVKIPSKTMRIGIVSDIWKSVGQGSVMYAVELDDGTKGLYAENQLEPAPLPIEYSFTATVENNVAVVCMIATQGEKTWVQARGHAHVIHAGAVGAAQAISYASKRMFEELDTQQENRIYFKEVTK